MKAIVYRFVKLVAGCLMPLFITACSTHQPSQVIVEDRRSLNGVSVEESSPTLTTEEPNKAAPKVMVPVYSGQPENRAEPQYQQEQQTQHQSKGHSPEESRSNNSSSVTSAPAIEPKGAVLALLEKAETQHQQGEHQQALNSLERAQRIAPRQPLIYLQLAQIHRDMGNVGRAEQFARKGLSLAGSDERLHRAFNAMIRQLGQ